MVYCFFGLIGFVFVDVSESGICQVYSRMEYGEIG
jgi:hypothetical protein